MCLEQCLLTVCKTIFGAENADGCVKLQGHCIYLTFPFYDPLTCVKKMLVV